MNAQTPSDTPAPTPAQRQKRKRQTKADRTAHGLPSYIRQHTMPMMRLTLHWHLGALLTRYNIPRMQLEFVSGVSVNTILSLTRDELDRFNVSNAQNILNGLRALTGADLQISDLVTVSASIDGQMVSVLTDAPPPPVNPGPLFESLPAPKLKPAIEPSRVPEPEDQEGETTPEAEAPTLAAEPLLTPEPDDAPAPAPEVKPSKPSKPRKRRAPDGPTGKPVKLRSIASLLQDAEAQGLKVFIIPGTGVNKGSEIGVACSSKSRLREITGLGNNLIYNSGKLVENPEDAQILTDILSKPGGIFIRKAGETRFTHAS